MSEYDCVLLEHVSLVTRAAHFAATRHSGQTRKGKAAEPYINHLAEVASLLASSLHEPDAYLVAAGWLHDTIEDTGTTRDELCERFGMLVTDMVMEVTDDKSLPKAERKRLQVVNTPHKSERARLIKLADKTSNLNAIATSPPGDWDTSRCYAYVDWADSVAVSCFGLNATLDKAYVMAASTARHAIGERSLLIDDLKGAR
jgi:(p)ppGpp synthase/HD superfamily hydrolase